MSATIMGKNMVSRDDLAAMPLPESCGPKHHPVPHIAVVEAIGAAARDRGLGILREEFALQRDGDMIFGVFDLRAIGAGGDMPLVQNDESGMSLGFRGSNDRQMSIQMVAGRRVFVCDNLAFSGDMFAMRRKHTSGLDLGEEIGEGIDRYLTHSVRLANQIERLRNDSMHDDTAKRLIFDAFHQRVLPISHFPRVARNYLTPTEEMVDCQPRNRWGLHNAFTREIRTMRPEKRFERAVGLGRFFGIGTAN
jgi:hypothetical protein